MHCSCRKSWYDTETRSWMTNDPETGDPVQIKGRVCPHCGEALFSDAAPSPGPRRAGAPDAYIADA